MSKILEINNLKKTFYKNKIPFTAVDSISFSMEKVSAWDWWVRAAVEKALLPD